MHNVSVRFSRRSSIAPRGGTVLRGAVHEIGGVTVVLLGAVRWT